MNGACSCLASGMPAVAPGQQCHIVRRATIPIEYTCTMRGSPRQPCSVKACRLSLGLTGFNLLQAVDSSIVDLENLRRTTETDENAAAAAAAEEARLRGVITKSR